MSQDFISRAYGEIQLTVLFERKIIFIYANFCHRSKALA
jgi:hypothetical protein